MKTNVANKNITYLLLWIWALVNWLQLLALKVGDLGLEPHSGRQVSKK